MNTDNLKRPSLGMALIPIVISLAIFILGIGIMKYPAELMLLFAGIVFAIFAIFHGNRWETIIEVMGVQNKKGTSSHSHLVLYWVTNRDMDDIRNDPFICILWS
ncbi:hypothetical protein [Gracilibacillus sp. JCM 18860]|uniref:hypothetical protein n=1 Tax=Gracilibacillus sp. JCM 18860 TaxID=1306159 RepID=UPI000ADBEB79